MHFQVQVLCILSLFCAYDLSNNNKEGSSDLQNITFLTDFEKKTKA